jgi:23S rRNA (cytidine1920-2'-O)/16S rRNA (cytidine1409-2'-O)-methyltransferase
MQQIHCQLSIINYQFLSVPLCLCGEFFFKGLPDMTPFVSRAGEKLNFALDTFSIDVVGLVCADLGSNAGGFVECLLRRGAIRVYAIDTGYGMLDWKLRNNPFVVVMERTNAMHATLPEKVSLVTIDVAWTRQRHILPAARKMLAENGKVITLIKPHYEAESRQLRKGVLPPDQLESVLEIARKDIQSAGFQILAQSPSPLKGQKGNAEYLCVLVPTEGIG